MTVQFEAGPLTDSKKTGVGHYIERTVRALANNQGDNIHLEGYYFNFLGLNSNYLPTIPQVDFHRIWLIPGKILSVCQRLGFQPFLELFTWDSGDILFFTNYVMLPTVRRRKTALAIYDLGYLDHPEYVQEVNLKYMQRFCTPSIRKADLIVTISEFTKQRLLSHFPDLQARIVVTPIPPDPLKLEATTQIPDRLLKLGIHPEQYLLFLSTIEPRKNIQLLLQAYRQLNHNVRKKYALVLAGGKGWKDEAILADIQTLRSKGLSIITTGYVSDVEKSALYANCRSFVLPSQYEGFGMPLLEAMQYGKPIAISDIPVFHEAAGNAAIYFNQNNPEDISHALNVVLTNESRRSELIALGTTQLRTFSWEENAIQLVHAFESIVHP